MNKEEIANISQLLVGMKELSTKLAAAVKKKDMEEVVRIKREILNLQKQVDSAL